MICNYKRGNKSCTETCHETSGGIKRSKCKLHLAAANKSSRHRAIKKSMASGLTGEGIQGIKDLSKRESLTRMRKYRTGRKALLDGIEDPIVKMIAVFLDGIKDNKKYVIVPDIISKDIVPEKIKLVGKIKRITFSDEGVRSKRTMQLVKDPKKILSDLMAAINLVFPACSAIEVKMLKSEAGDTEQLTHTDYVPGRIQTNLLHLNAFHYSAVISVEENTRLLVGKALEEVSIPLHSMIFFRGDMLHAGAAYSTSNRRLFLSASSKSFPTSEVSRE